MHGQSTRKRRITAATERSFFSGLLKCSDCGTNLGFHFNQKNRDIRYYNCTNNNSGRGDCTSTHYIRVDFLEQIVLQEIRRLTKFASEYENDFAKALIGHSMQAAETERAIKEKNLKTLLIRDKELDKIIESLYESNIAGKISDERFGKMSRNYEQEQGELARQIKALRKELQKYSDQLYSTDSFLEIVRSYTDATTLTQRMVSELINHIDVYHATRVNGEITQEIKIHYNCIGAFDVPDREHIPELEVLIETRKGVVLSYSTVKQAG